MRYVFVYDTSMHVFLQRNTWHFLIDRLSFLRKCKQVAGSALTTRTNVLLVRQNLLSAGNGVLLSYNSQKNMKKSHHQSK